MDLGPGRLNALKKKNLQIKYTDKYQLDLHMRDLGDDKLDKALKGEDRTNRSFGIAG